jgi:hypothetical protein
VQQAEQNRPHIVGLDGKNIAAEKRIGRSHSLISVGRTMFISGLLFIQVEL